jgi:hypothetical protein
MSIVTVVSVQQKSCSSRSLRLRIHDLLCSEPSRVSRHVRLVVLQRVTFMKVDLT